MQWLRRLDPSWLSIVKASRAAGQRAHQVTTQSLKMARLTGARLARKVIAIQQAARLDPRLMRESARSVANRSMTRESDRQWQAAYVATARQLVPGLAPAAPPPPEPPKAWPYKDGFTMADPEAGQ